MTRDAEIAGFLARHGYAGALAAPLAQDASFRRYLRLTGGRRPAVLMDAPPPEDVRPFLRIAAHLAGIGISVPEIFAADAAAGLVLEEDLGDALYPAVMGEGSHTTPPPLEGGGWGGGGGGGGGGGPRRPPPPRRPGGGGGGPPPPPRRKCRTDAHCPETPPPNPLPQGEGEQCASPPPSHSSSTPPSTCSW
jgi:hypothetical protein